MSSHVFPNGRVGLQRLPLCLEPTLFPLVAMFLLLLMTRIFFLNSIGPQTPDPCFGNLSVDFRLHLLLTNHWISPFILRSAR